MLDFGATFLPDPPSQRFVELVVRAEELGFTHAWTYDSHILWEEGYIYLTLAVSATSRIHLGHCVTNPGIRVPTVTASAYATLQQLSFLPTGAGTHGMYPSRDARQLYVSNRLAGTISVIDYATRQIVASWAVPGGSPDMGGVSADGSELWLSGRYNSEVYVINTTTGALKRIPVGKGPHGLCVFPQPGKISLGHTGNYR